MYVHRRSLASRPGRDGWGAQYLFVTRPSPAPCSRSTYRGALALAQLPGLGALAALPPDPGLLLRAPALLGLLRGLPAEVRSALLAALSAAYRDAALPKETRDAAVCLCCLLLAGALLRLSAGREVDPGALLGAVASAAGRGRRLWWAVQDAARAERRERPEPLAGEVPEVGNFADLDATIDQRAALAALSGRDSLLLSLAADGASAREIGAALGVSERGAEKALERARARLKK